ncbi:MAG TPA: hypothetical protein VLC09_15400 [Polyangiaceae bacterium]|nr:hypothetical protein [Polyangiaceae bacterium]
MSWRFASRLAGAALILLPSLRPAWAAETSAALDEEAFVDGDDDAAEEDDASEAAADDTANGTLPSPLESHLGVALYGRTFRYTEPLNGDPYVPLNDYTLPAAPAPFVDLTWFPGAHFTDSWLAHVGVRGGYRLGIATTVSNPAPSGGNLTQESSSWFVGARVRVPIELGEALGRVTLSATGDYAAHRMALTGGAPNDQTFPDIDYRLLQLGGDAEWRISGMIIGMSALYLPVLSTGDGSANSLDGANWFPNAHGWGIDLGGRVGWELSDWADLLVGVEYRSYGLSFAPNTGIPGDPNTKVAGGATDRTVSAWLGLGFRIPERAVKRAGAGESAPAKAPEDNETSQDDFDSFE